LCFSVPHGVQPPPSLINIYKALKKDIPSFRIPKHGNLINWTKAGVLLLNTSLTVRAHEAASHSGRGWEKFTDAVIKYLNDKKSGLVFMLWGNHAIKKGKNINKVNNFFLIFKQLLNIVHQELNFFHIFLRPNISFYKQFTRHHCLLIVDFLIVVIGLKLMNT
jgi:uracil-DNA glycosylase